MKECPLCVLKHFFPSSSSSPSCYSLYPRSVFLSPAGHSATEGRVKEFRYCISIFPASYILQERRTFTGGPQVVCTNASFPSRPRRGSLSINFSSQEQKYGKKVAYSGNFPLPYIALSCPSISFPRAGNTRTRRRVAGDRQ